MNTLYIVPIEPLENRYTGHWHKYLPEQFKEFCPGYNIFQIVSGQTLSDTTDLGAFLNFTSTANYKATQLESIAKMFHKNNIIDGDIFLVTDAWNPCVHMIRYMADLSGIKIHMIGIWHAGHYDPYDILARNLKDKEWSLRLEQSLYHLYDKNIFATKFHRDMFMKNLFLTEDHVEDKSLISGFPCEYYSKLEDLHNRDEKKKIILFPHRKSIEKAPQDFEWLKTQLPDYEFKYLQAKTKEEYHKALREAKFVFSSAEQETLGFSIYEGLLAGCIPIVPNRLSYKEVYDLVCRYNNLLDVPDIISAFETLDSEDIRKSLRVEADYIERKFFNGTKLYDHINNI